MTSAGRLRSLIPAATNALSEIPRISALLLSLSPLSVAFAQRERRKSPARGEGGGGGKGGETDHLNMGAQKKTVLAPGTRDQSLDPNRNIALKSDLLGA